MKYNISKLIGGIVVFCLAVGGVFGYALYGAGKKSAQDQQVKGSTDATVEESVVG